MPKFNGIEYKILVEEDKGYVVFTHDGVEQKLPLALGQSAYNILTLHFDKTNRGTRKVRSPKEAYNLHDEAVLKFLVVIAMEAGREWNLSYEKVRHLKRLANMKGVSEELKQDALTLADMITAGRYTISKSQLQLLLDTRENSTHKTTMKLYKILEPEILAKKAIRDEIIVAISDTYEAHKHRLHVVEPRSIKIPARPIKEWF